MARLTLKASSAEERIVLNYLEENASEELVEKINSGTRTMGDCWNYIRNKAKQKATSNCAVVQDTEVFGWAVHFFEEAKEALDREAAAEKSLLQQRNERRQKEAEAERKKKLEEQLERQAKEAAEKERERQERLAAAAAKKAAEEEERRKKKEAQKTGAVAGQTTLFDFFGLEG